jgi:hypothetical protein
VVSANVAASKTKTFIRLPSLRQKSGISILGLPFWPPGIEKYTASGLDCDQVFGGASASAQNGLGGHRKQTGT